MLPMEHIRRGLHFLPHIDPDIVLYVSNSRISFPEILECPFAPLSAPYSSLSRWTSPWHVRSRFDAIDNP